jgi:hypothetical protein
MPQSTLKGGCLCGTVKYEVLGEPKRFYYCHCSGCRKVTGTGHASNLFLQPAQLTWFGAVVMIPAGSLDDAAPIGPQARIFSGSRANWSCRDGEIPAYPELPPQ